MIRNLVSARRARGLALGLMLVPGTACSSVSSRMPGHVAPEIAADATAKFAESERTPVDLPSGARIRYNTRNSWYGMRTGEIARASADTLWLESRLWRFERARAVPVASLQRLDYSPQGNTKLRKVFLAAAIGAAVGAAVGASVPPRECDRCPSGESGPTYPADQGFTPLLVGMYGAIVGGLGTALIVPDEKWTKVELPLRDR